MLALVKMTSSSLLGGWRTGAACLGDLAAPPLWEERLAETHVEWERMKMEYFWLKTISRETLIIRVVGTHFFPTPVFKSSRFAGRLPFSLRVGTWGERRAAFIAAKLSAAL